MKTIRNLLTKYKHAWVFLYVLIYMPWFAWLEAHVTNNFHIIHMTVDDHIPFIEYFIIPYLLWFAYVAVGVGYFFFKNKNDFYRLCIFLFVGMTVFLIISTIYPNGHTLRPTTFNRDNIFTQAVAWLYATDTATNLFPSIHVYNSLGIHLAVLKSDCMKDKNIIKNISFILCTSIILSTMFLKQHSFFDVITAFVMALIMYCLVYMRNTDTASQKAYKKQYNRI